MSTLEPLVTLLADGQVHSGERLAEVLGVSRTAIWKAISDIRERGIPVISLDRRGYQLERPVELLHLENLRVVAARHGRRLPNATEVIFELGSTNEYLYDAAAPPAGQPRLVFAELQTAGRGRRGRSWLAPFGAGLTFSIGWTFAETPADLSALSLAMGVCVVRSLRRLGASRLMLKWPNDVVLDHRKLGGLLAQLRAEAGGPAYVVIGLGLNLCAPRALRQALADAANTPVADLAEAWDEDPRTRSEIAVHVAAEMLEGLDLFTRAGFAPFAQEWAALDSLRDAPVEIFRHEGCIAGTARGADADGALLVETGGNVLRVHAGEVSLRRAPRSKEPAA